MIERANDPAAPLESEEMASSANASSCGRLSSEYRRSSADAASRANTSRAAIWRQLSEARSRSLNLVSLNTAASVMVAASVGWAIRPKRTTDHTQPLRHTAQVGSSRLVYHEP